MEEVKPVEVEQVEFNHTEVAEVAYNTYATMVDFKDSTGAQMMQYGDSSLENRRAWEAAVKAAVECYVAAKTPVETVSRFAPSPDSSMDQPVEAYSQEMFSTGSMEPDVDENSV